MNDCRKNMNEIPQINSWSLLNTEFLKIQGQWYVIVNKNLSERLEFLKFSQIFKKHLKSMI